jgi:hypothetical protein
VKTTTVTSEAHDPDELEDRADELEIEARRLRQKARHLRRSGPGAVVWLDDDACHARYGVGIYSFQQAAKRGELEIARVGRSPRVREDVADRWIAARGKIAPPAADAPPSDVYASAVASMRGGRP